jgi:hypothetical protein
MNNLFTAELADEIRKPGGVDRALGAMQREFFPASSSATPCAVVSSASWREEHGIIYLTVTSDGTTGEEWISRIERKGLRMGRCAKSILCSTAFIPTSGTVYRIAVLKGSLFFDRERRTSNIRTKASKRGFIKPHPEVACLIRDALSDNDINAMGLWHIVAMHDPIRDYNGNPYLLDAYRVGIGCWLDACRISTDGMWGRDYGFAFLQV